MISMVTIEGAKNIFSIPLATNRQFLRLFQTNTFNVRTARIVFSSSRLTWADGVEHGASSPIFFYLELAAPMMTDHGNGLVAAAW